MELIYKYSLQLPTTRSRPEWPQLQLKIVHKTGIIEKFVISIDELYLPELGFPPPYC
jgi:hypothetical protein